MCIVSLAPGVTKLRTAGAIALIVVVLCVAGCGGKAATRLSVRLSEWEVTLSADEIEAGKVHLTVTNAGARPHELLIVKTDLPPGGLELSEGRVDEARLNVVRRVEALAPGASQDIDLQLTGGKYVLLCNLVDVAGGQTVHHYENGMFAGLFVAP